MHSFSVSSRGLPAVEVTAVNWISALGLGLHELGRDQDIARLACEQLANGTVIARDISSGAGYIVQPHLAAAEPSPPRAPLSMQSSGEFEALAPPTDEVESLPLDAIQDLDDSGELGRIAEAHSTAEALRLALTLAQDRIPAESGAVLLEVKGHLQFAAVTGPHARRLDGVRLPLGTGVAGYVMERRRTAVVEDAHEDPRHCGEVDALTGYRTGEICVVPMISGHKVLGVLELMNRTDHKRFTDQDVRWLQALAAALSTRIAKD